MNVLEKKREDIKIRDILLTPSDTYIKNKDNDKISTLIPDYTNINFMKDVELYLIFQVLVLPAADNYLILKKYASVNLLRRSENCKLGQYNIIIADILSQLIQKSSNCNRNHFFDITNDNILNEKPLNHVMSLIDKYKIDDFVQNMANIWGCSFNSNYKSFKLPKANLLCNYLILDQLCLKLTESNNGSGTDVNIYIATPFEKTQFINISANEVKENDI